MESNHYSLRDFVQSQSKDIFYKAKLFAEFRSDGEQKGYTDPYLIEVLTQSANRVQCRHKGREIELIQMNNANYLGLSSHPKVIASAQDAIASYGASICAVPLIAGTTDAHRILEKELAEFKKMQGAVLYPTGYGANMGTIAALVQPGDTVVVDKQVHYSIIEGIKLSGAQIASFRHSDIEHLGAVLEKLRNNPKTQGILIIVEGVYGIDGDIAPLPDILYLSKKYCARLMVDDCHATGVVGCTGAGTAEHFGVEGQVDIVMDSLSKALGSMGGWIGASKNIIDYLRYFSKPITFAVGLQPASASAALASLRLIKDDPSIVNELQIKIAYFKERLLERGYQNVKKSGSAIMSMVIGDELKLRKINHELLEQGLWVEGIPYPAVPKGQERIRIRINANHSREDLKQAADILHRTLSRNKAQESLRAPSVAVAEAFQKVTKTEYSCHEARSPEEFKELAHFCFNLDSQIEPKPIWYTLEEKVRQLSGDYRYIRNNVKLRVFYARKNGEVVACLAASRDEKVLGLSNDKQAFIGSVSVVPGEEAMAGSLLDIATACLKNAGAKTILAPIDVPMVIYGGGGTPDASRLNPFFQPIYATRIQKLLKRHGFSESRKLPYFEFDLARLALETPGLPAGVEIRSLDKFHWHEEMKIVLGLLNETFTALGHYWGMELEEFKDYADSFSELVEADYWLIASVNGLPVGFISGFPSNPDAILEMGGTVSLADYDHFRTLLKSRNKAAIVWATVLPAHAQDGLLEALYRHLLRNMKNRGVQHVSATWEIAARGPASPEMILGLGGTVSDFELTIFSKNAELD